MIPNSRFVLPVKNESTINYFRRTRRLENESSPKQKAQQKRQCINDNFDNTH